MGFLNRFATIGRYDRSTDTVAKFPGLTKRQNTWVLRAFVPKDLQTVFGRKEIVKALGTSDPAEAVKRAKIKTAEFETKFETARREMKSTAADPVPTPAALSFCRSMTPRVRA